MKLLILEDDSTIGKGLEYSLTQEGYQAKLCPSIASAMAELTLQPYDLYLLDLTLPDGSGYDVCKAVKERGNAPVIFLTAFDDEVNVIMGLEMGADDYISKPFRVRELLARIKTVLRRGTSGNESGVIQIDDIVANTKEGRIYKKKELLFMTALEYRLFLSLLHNRGNVMSRSQLLESIWDVAGDFVNDNTLSVYIKRIREKVETDPNNPRIIKTVRGIGYKID